MSDKGNVLVPLLDGFEEIEAVTIIDVLRRANVPVTVAGERAGPVRGSHGIEVQAEVALANVTTEGLRMIVLPGGMPGAANLSAHPIVQDLIKEMAGSGRYTCAVCAGPMALGTAGVLAGKRATCYPGYEDRLTGAQFTDERVVVDGKVVTSRGPGTAMEFALTLVGILAGAQTEQRLTRGMLVQRAHAPVVS